MSPWPKGRTPTWDIGRKEDNDPCPRGHVGDFYRNGGARKCRVCRRYRMKLSRWNR